MNNFTFGDLLMGLGFGLTSAICFSKYKQIGIRKEQLQQVQESQIKDLSYIDKMKQNQSCFIKAKLKNTQQNKSISTNQHMPISYNQYYLQQPSDWVVLRTLEMNQQYRSIFPKVNMNLVDTFGREKQIRGTREIIGDCFTLKKKYESHEPGSLVRFWGGICYAIQSIFNFIRKGKFYEVTTTHIPQNRKPFIMGPIIGTLYYTVGLLTDTYFVLKIKFENGLHQVHIVAQSKNSLIRFYESEISVNKFQVLFFGFFAVLSGYYLYRSFKKVQYFRKLYESIAINKDNMLQLQNADQDKTCIICYTKCRNLVFFDCKHLILCWSCWVNMKELKCPICKNIITQTKIIYQDKSQKQKLKQIVNKENGS